MTGFSSILERAVDIVDPQPDPYFHDPVGWAWDKLGIYLWSKQREVAESVRDNRHTATHSAHGTGKSLDAAVLAAWWLSTRPPEESFVITTAPTQPQVEAILWREIGKIHRKGNLQGHVGGGNQPTWKINGMLVGYGRKPADYTDASQAAAAFQGIHARYVLVILDEACGIPDWLWTATESIVTNVHSRILAIGNPDDSSGEFAKVCQPGSGWNTIHISAFDLPAFTGEKVPEELDDLLTGKDWVEERGRRWGKESPLYISKVLGLFPEVSDDTLFTPKMIREAVQRDLSAEALKDKGRFGADVARYGRDETMVYRWRAGHVRMVYRGHKNDTMKTAGAFKGILDKHPFVTMMVDVIGIGAGVYDRMKELGCQVSPFNASEKARNQVRYLNKRAEAFWSLRELAEEGMLDIDPLDEDLQAELGMIKYDTNSAGRIFIESKDDMRKRGFSSPNRADAVVMAATAPSSLPPTPQTADESTITSDLLDRPM